MSKAEERQIAVDNQEAGLIILQQTRPCALFEVVARKTSFQGVVVDFGPVVTVKAPNIECACDKYKAANPDCVGSDLVGSWKTIANAVQL